MAYSEYSPGNTLCQYMDTSGLKGILKSKKLWMTDLRYAHDPREINFGIDMLKAQRSSLLSEVPEAYKRPLLESLINYSIAHFNNHNIFTACFTLDSDSLPMWKMYGDDGRGVVVGFRPTAIMDMPGRLQKVEYVDKDDREILRSYLMREFRELEHLIDNAQPVDKGNFTGNFFGSITRVKHSSWRQESEVRLSVSQIKDPNHPAYLRLGIDDRGVRREWAEPLLRERGDENVPYTAERFGKLASGVNDHRRAIKFVRLGPKAEMGHSEVCELLSDNEFQDVQVLTSECEFR